jgi:hypothetical protein
MVKKEKRRKGQLLFVLQDERYLLKKKIQDEKYRKNI